jgi:DNA-binding response OmpR family regulator
MAYRTDMPAIATTPAPPTAVPAGRVLVVDDEPEVANFVARALRRRGLRCRPGAQRRAYVHRLRDKLGRGLIHTVRSLGYVLDV